MTVKLICALPLVGALLGCNPVDKFRHFKNKWNTDTVGPAVTVTNKKMKVRVPAKKALTLEGDWDNPFIVLMTEKTGRIAGYYRVKGKIKYVGPRWKEREFILKCGGEECVLKDEKLSDYRPSHILFETVDGCFFRWSANYMLSQTEVILNEKPVLAGCKPLGGNARRRK